MNGKDRARSILHEDLSRRRLLQLLGVTAGAGTVALTLPGCSDASNNPGGGTNAPGPLTIAYGSPIVNLDPHGTSAQETATKLAARQLYNSMVTYTNGTYQPSLATSWSQPEPTKWVFKLRTDVVYHDGSPLVADDVVASLNRIVALKGPLAPLWSTLVSIEAVDSHTVAVTTRVQLGTMLSNMSSLFVLPASQLSGTPSFTKPIGSGPYMCDSFVSSDHLTLSPNSKYWNGAPKLASVKFPYIPQESSRISGLINGESDVTWPITYDQLAQLDGRNGINVNISPSNIQFTSWFNCGRKPFSDVAVRKAMWQGLNVDALIKGIWGTTATKATGPIASTIFGFAPQTPVNYDPTAAKAALAAAGYPNGFSTSLTWSVGVLPQVDQIAQAMASDWSKIGVTVKLQPMQPADGTAKLLALDWDMFLLPLGGNPDADFVLGRLYTTTAKRMGYSNPDLDGILASAKSSLDQDVRKSLYAQACKIVWDNAVSAFIADIKIANGARSRVQNFAVQPDGVALLEPTAVGV